MNSVLRRSPLLTLMNRPATFMNVFIVVAISVTGYFALGFAARSLPFVLPEGMQALSSQGKLVLGGCCAMAALGLLLSGVCQEALYRRSTWAFPGLARRLRLHAWCGFLLGFLLFVTFLWWLQAPLALAVIPLFTAAAALAPADPRVESRLVIPGLLLLLVVPLFAERLVPVAHHFFWLLGPLGLTLAWFALARAFSRKIRRQVLASSLIIADINSEQAAAFRPWNNRLQRGVLVDEPWTRGQIRTLTDRRHALNFESWGWKRGTWPLPDLYGMGPGLAICLTLTVFVMVANLHLLRGPKSIFAPLLHLLGNEPLTISPLEPFALYARAIGDNLYLVLTQRVFHPVLDAGATWTLSSVIPFTIFFTMLLISLSMQPSFQKQRLYAISRSERAELLWRTSFTKWTSALAKLLVVPALLTFVLSFALEHAFPSHPTPVIVTLSMACMCLPLFQSKLLMLAILPRNRLGPIKQLIGYQFMAALSASPIFAGAQIIQRMDTPAAWAWVAIGFVVGLALQVILRWRLAEVMRYADLD